MMFEKENIKSVLNFLSTNQLFFHNAYYVLTFYTYTEYQNWEI
jgi:hypothetical protein